MTVEDHDMSDWFFPFGDGSRHDHEDSLLGRCGIRPVGSNRHHSFSQAFEERHFREQFGDLSTVKNCQGEKGGQNTEQRTRDGKPEGHVPA